MSTTTTDPREYKVHQLSPYVGKLKSLTAGSLVSRFSEPGDLVVDPFVGSGTIPLEAKLLGRSTFSSDVSDYAKVITLGKLNTPENTEQALKRLERLIELAIYEPSPDLRGVPYWVRSFFHPQTLKESIQFANICIRRKEYFFLSCLLGILHHQRPGFLSFPSSHLTPYLRDKNFPQDKFPELYCYRDYRPRMRKKVVRALSNHDGTSRINLTQTTHQFRRASVDRLTWPQNIGAVITSPPYMNALDYGRDNRLRIWFLTRDDAFKIDDSNISTLKKFRSAMKVVANESGKRLKSGGYLVIVIGEIVDRGRQAHTAQIVQQTIAESKNLRFISEEKSPIPQVKRARRNCTAVKDEVSLIYQKK